MPATNPNPSLTARELVASWVRILSGRIPLLSIEITRECPLSCPGCYAYGDTHLTGGVKLTELNDRRGDELVEGVLDLVRKHKPKHVSLVGGEPMVRHRELSKILPELSKMGIFSLVVTSGIIPIPTEWMKLPRSRVAISVDGLPEHHDIRRKPATYEKILANIDGREVNIHWVITRPMLERPGYLEEYVKFWSERPEVNRIWVSVYTPQIGEQSPEMLTPENRIALAAQLPPLAKRYKKLLFNEGLAKAFLKPPSKSRRLRLRQTLGKLFRRSRNARRTLRLRRHSRLLAMRLRHQHRPALGPRRKNGRPPKSKSLHHQLRKNRPRNESPKIQPRPHLPLEPAHPATTRQNQARTNPAVSFTCRHSEPLFGEESLLVFCDPTKTT